MPDLVLRADDAVAAVAVTPVVDAAEAAAVDETEGDAEPAAAGFPAAPVTAATGHCFAVG